MIKIRSNLVRSINKKSNFLLMSIPKIIFIVPYRDREVQKTFFHHHMTTYILKDLQESDYKIYYIHQLGELPFNRGAMKNIGFQVMKEKYPEDYKDLTFVFNDVDTAPLVPNLINYETEKNVVKHFYGFKHALGGIFSIKGSDFEKTNGFPNYWSWGYEDSEMQLRVAAKNIQINRDTFYPILDKNFLLLHDDIYRLVNRKEVERHGHHPVEGLAEITNLNYSFEENNHMFHIHNFKTPFEYDETKDKVIDLRKGGIPFPPKKSKMMSLNFN